LLETSEIFQHKNCLVRTNILLVKKQAFIALILDISSNLDFNFCSVVFYGNPGVLQIKNEKIGTMLKCAHKCILDKDSICLNCKINVL